MSKQRKFDSRESDEKAEGEKVIETEVSDAKFQPKQQVVKPVEQGEKAAPGANGFTPKVNKTKGSQLKQEKVAEVITGSSGVAPGEGLASPSRAGLRTLAYSGNEGTILGSASGTPVVGTPSRSDNRPGQKLDAVAKAIDFIANEQVIQDFDGSKPLQDNPTEPQGFLGHPENNNARMQKIAECVPGALLFARSCDEISRDEIAFVRGQMIKEANVNDHSDVTKTYDIITKSYKAYSNPRGNYVPKTMHITVSRDGEIVGLSFDVDDLSITGSADVLNRSSSAYQRAMNKDEINRQNMESKAGIETEKNWCPLVRAIAEPTATIGHLTDQEVVDGSEKFMAYRFLNKAHAYQFNKAAKDGQTPYRSFKELLYGNAVKFQDSTQVDSTRGNFLLSDYLNGAPSLMIALYDSIAKYSKRGDLFVQPRSWRMHKQTADNNINPFKVDPDFAKYVANRDVFSTIERGYDPFLPVCISDNWRLSHTLNFDKLLHLSKSTVFIAQLGGKGLMTAGDAFNNLYDDEDGVATLCWYDASTSTAGNDVYYQQPISKTYGAPKIIFATDKTGTTYNLGLAAAIAKLDEIDHLGNNAHLKPYVILFKVDDTIDKVYAVCRFPDVYDVTVDHTACNLQLFIAKSTTADYMTSDVNKDYVKYEAITLMNDNLVYKYQNRQNPYIVEVKNPLLYGILEWARNMGTKLANPSVSHSTATRTSFEDNQKAITYHIPVVHSTTQISLWDLIVCASVPFSQKIRTNSMFDVLNYEDNNGSYPFDQLVSLSEANPLTCVNYAFKDILQPLVVGQMKAAVALSWIMPEKFWRIDHTYSSSTMSNEKFVLPFYFSEEQFNYVDSSGTILAHRDDDGFVMNFPSTRAGARLAFTDMFYSMTERDVRLSLDMMTDIPGGASALGLYPIVGVYKYGLSNSGIPVVSYDSSDKQLTVGLYLTTPRELGLGMVAPAGYNRVLTSKHLLNNLVAYSDYATKDALLSAGSSYIARAWRVQGGNYQSFHNPLSVIVDRGGNFAQDWALCADCIYADTDNTAVESYGTLDAAVKFAICMNFNDIMEVGNGVIAGESGKSVFHPYTDGGLNNVSTLPSIITLQNALWPRLQVLPFALSPFDQTPEGRYISSDHVTVDMTADPYDFMIIFGFCGFKGSDFREDISNRIYEKQTLGWTFVRDPFVDASPVLK